VLDTLINSGNHEGPFPAIQGKKFMGPFMQFVKAIVTDVSFTITFTN
jgi:hypothetical protein